MDTSTASLETSPRDDIARTKKLSEGEPTAGSHERMSLPENTGTAQNAPGKTVQAAAGDAVPIDENSLNQIVVHYLDKKGYTRTAAVLKTEARALRRDNGPSPSQSRRLLESFGPQEGVQLATQEKEALSSLEDALEELSMGLNWEAIKLRLISHIATQNADGELRSSSIEKEGGRLQSIKQRHQQYVPPQLQRGEEPKPFAPAYKFLEKRRSQLQKEEGELRSYLNQMDPSYSHYDAHIIQRLHSFSKAISFAIEATETAYPSIAPVKYPLTESVHRFADGLVVGQSPDGFVIGQIYHPHGPPVDSVEPLQEQNDNNSIETEEGESALKAEIEAALNESNESAEDTGSRPPTPNRAGRPGNESPARSLSRARSVDSTDSVRGTKRKFNDAAERIYFCFHDSCSQSYANPKPLETHIERTHKDKWPELPGTCDHDGSVKTFRKWDASLSHLIHHQKEYGMTRKQYDQIHHTALFWLTHSDMRVNREDASAVPLSNTNSPSHFAFDPGLGMNFDMNTMPWDPPA